ncbi:hypothetical protein [Bradyrhizobium mercantei]|nr:hypothetical protein [Bradyrhizobium mercantei]
MPGFAPGIFVSGEHDPEKCERFSEKIMLKKGAEARRSHRALL